ncbi:MAG: DUF3857 domain-containing protein [Candidatus Omnitrophica bacterium]|nr:DUF3857 domain-containing protein [Candidatus Omnitrophota bacterium]
MPIFRTPKLRKNIIWEVYASRFILFVAIAALLGCAPQPMDKPINSDDFGDFSERYEDLISKHQELLKSDPQNNSLRLELGQFYYGFKDYQRTIDLFKGFDLIQARVILAKAYTRLKEYALAIEIFEQLKPLPKDPEYLYLYGTVLEEKNLFPKALKIYAKVTPPFESRAKERIKAIGAKVEEGIPLEIKEITKSAESFLTEINDDAAVYLLVDEATEITPKNTSVSTVHVIEQVLKERGKKLAEVDIGYDSTYQRIELEFARTITKEGQVRYVGEENIRDVSRYLNFPLYSNSRARIISMPSVDVGSFIEYKFKIYSSKLVNEDKFTFIYRLREQYPVFKAYFNLVTPRESPVNFKFFNQNYAEGIDLKPSLSESDDSKVYRWEFNRIKPIIPEYSMPSYAYVNPAILISSFSSWDEIYEWWESLYQDKIQVTESMREFLSKIIETATDDFGKAREIHEFVAKNIRYVAIEYGEGGHEPHSAQEVFVNRYGDCKDQAVLLVSLLREAGLKAYPVLIPTDSVYPIEESFPSINFNHAIAAVEIDDKLIFMDPTSETTPFMDIPLSDQNRSVMVFFDQGWKIVTTDTLKKNRVKYDMKITVDADENAKVIRRVISSGFFAASYRWYLKYTHPALIEEDLRKKMREISSLSTFVDYSIKNVDDFSKNPMLTYNFEAKKVLNPAGDLRILPVLDQLQLDHKLISKDQRKYPIDFEGLHGRDSKIRIILPENLKVKYLPETFILENPWFDLQVSYKKLDQGIDFHQNFKMKKRFVEAEEYSRFEKFLEDAIYRLREEIILEKVK